MALGRKRDVISIAIGRSGCIFSEQRRDGFARRGRASRGFLWAAGPAYDGRPRSSAGVNAPRTPRPVWSRRGSRSCTGLEDRLRKGPVQFAAMKSWWPSEGPGPFYVSLACVVERWRGRRWQCAITYLRDTAQQAGCDETLAMRPDWLGAGGESVRGPEEPGHFARLQAVFRGSGAEGLNLAGRLAGYDGFARTNRGRQGCNGPEPERKDAVVEQACCDRGS